MSRLPLDSTSYSKLAFVANSLINFPDMSRMVKDIGDFVTDEMKWVDDFALEERPVSSIIGRLARYLGWIWAFMVIPFLGIPSLRDWVIATWGTVPKVIPYDYLGLIAAIVVLFIMFRWAESFGPSLISVRPFIQSLKEATNPSL